MADATLPTEVSKGGRMRSPGSTELRDKTAVSLLCDVLDDTETYLLSFRTGPSLMSTSNKWIFWYRCVISPFSLIQRTVFLTLRGSIPGSCIPT